jgi:hypothetical protein
MNLLALATCLLLAIHEHGYSGISEHGHAYINSASEQRLEQLIASAPWQTLLLLGSKYDLRTTVPVLTDDAEALALYMNFETASSLGPWRKPGQTQRAV